jgi:hypothetical protein
MSLISEWVDSTLEATGMDAVHALRAFFLLAAATVRIRPVIVVIVNTTCR